MGAQKNNINPGDVFGRWLVLEYAGQDANGKRLWKVCCQLCGKTESVVRASKLANGRSKACINCCHYTHTIHGLSRTHAYKIAQGIQERITNPKHIGWADYGGRGITLYGPWHGPAGRILMARWIINNLPSWQPGLSIERIDNNRGYEPGNLRWATSVEQANNRRSNRPIEWEGRTQNLKQWAKELGIPRDTLARRLDSGWELDRAMTTPVGRNGRRGPEVRLKEAA